MKTFIFCTVAIITDLFVVAPLTMACLSRAHHYNPSVPALGWVTVFWLVTAISLVIGTTLSISKLLDD